MTTAVIAAAAWHVATHELLAFAAVGLALSMVDDLVVDGVFLGFVAWRRTSVVPLPATADNPGWMAVIVPAWDESAVIGAMLGELVTRFDYPRYRVFVGLYPNDPAGRAAVAAVADARIEIVLCSRPGPTTKADCLNHLWRAVVAHEASGIM